MLPRRNLPAVLSRCSPLYRPVAALGLLAVLGCGNELPGEPPSPPAQPGAPVSVVAASARFQTGLAGGVLPEAFAVRVSDAEGQGLPGVAVHWIATDGPDVICAPDQKRCARQRLAVMTNTEGVSHVWYRPHRLGAGTVTALVPAVPQGQMSFDFETNGVLIRLTPRSDACGALHILGPDDRNEVTIPVGTPVEWEHVEVTLWYPDICVARIVSHIVPAGGLPFESQDMEFTDRFRFTPNVVGTWMFRESYTGSFGVITVVER